MHKINVEIKVESEETWELLCVLSSVLNEPISQIISNSISVDRIASFWTKSLSQRDGVRKAIKCRHPEQYKVIMEAVK